MMKFIIMDTKFGNIIKVDTVNENSRIDVNLKKGNYLIILYDKEQNKHTIKNFTVYNDSSLTFKIT